MYNLLTLGFNLFVGIRERKQNIHKTEKTANYDKKKKKNLENAGKR